MATEATPPAALTVTSMTAEAEKFTYIQRLGKLLAASGYFADVQDQAQACVKVLAGEELGIPPIAAMMGISIIKGKVALGANLIASRVRAHGYDYRFKRHDATGCVIEFLSKVEDGKRRVLGESSFSPADAEQAGIKSDMYRKFPKNMFFARAISNGARWFCPEVFAGAPVFTPEELGAPVDENGDVRQPEPLPAAAETPTDKPTTISGPTFGERLAKYTEQKVRVGGEAYYQVLAKHGFEHANEVLKRPPGERQVIYNDLLALPDLADTATEPPLPPAKKEADDDF